MNDYAKKIESALHAISNLIAEGKYHKALESIEELQKTHPNDINIGSNIFGFWIDIGFAINNKDLIKKGIAGGEEITKKLLEATHPVVYYNLANGYYTLYMTEDKNKPISDLVFNTNLQKSKEYYRKSLEGKRDMSLELLQMVLTNYANCLDHLGRGIQAINLYDQCLTNNKNFSMAIGNKAMALCFFADISGQYREGIYTMSYQTIQNLIDKKDILDIGGQLAQKSFKHMLSYIEGLVNDKSLLIKELKHPKYKDSDLSDFEKFYIEFSIKNHLFLNLHVHDNYCEAAISDPIFIRPITSSKDHDTFNKLAKYINQLKEDYITARLLLVQSQFKQKDFDNLSRRTSLANTLDYAEFNLYRGLLKSSFKSVANIFDKIAIFLNEYLDIGIKPDKVFWYTDKRDDYHKWNVWKDKEGIRKKIVDTENKSLYALLDIYRDFESGYYGKLVQIRNDLTHRTIIIYDPITGEPPKSYGMPVVTYEEMLQSTLEMMSISREALTYLINFVNSNELKKKGDYTKIFDMYVDTTQFLHL